VSIYYQDERVTLYHGDCIDLVDWLAADVLIMDPPYGSSHTEGNPRGGYGRRGNASGNRKGAPIGRGLDAATIANDGDTTFRDRALAMWGDRPALVFGSPRMADPPMKVRDRLVWDKRRPGMNGGPWRYRHESIYVTEGFNRTTDAAVSIFSAFPEQADHIHGKPLSLMSALVEAAPAGIVADPFAGSGTTLVAAARMGRRAIGVELEERYCEIIAKRLDQGVLDFGEGA